VAAWFLHHKRRHRDVTKPSISVVVPTFRPRAIWPTLDALLKQRRIAVDIIVVENGSSTLSDESRFRILVQSGCIRYLAIERANLNAARNAGLKAASSNVVAFTDDDCIPASDWCRNLANVFDRDETVAVACGPVDLQLPEDCPDWIRGPFRRYLSALDLGDETHDLVRGEWLVGANMAFRREALSIIGSFNESVGMMGDDPALAGNDELELMRRVEAQPPWRVVYYPPAGVRHRIDGGRLTPSYFEKRRYGQGRADCLLARISGTLRTWDDVGTNLEWHLTDLFSYLEDVDIARIEEAQVHHVNYARCVVSYALGFYQSALAHVAGKMSKAAAPTRRGRENAAIFVRCGRDAMEVLKESLLTLAEFRVNQQYDARCEEVVHRYLGYVNGMNSDQASSPVAGDAVAAQIAGVLRNNDPVEMVRFGLGFTVEQLGAYTGEIDCPVIVVRPGWRLDRMRGTLVRSRTRQDQRPVCPDNLLANAGLLAPYKHVAWPGAGRHRVIDTTSRRPAIDSPDDVVKLCRCIGGCLRLPVDDDRRALFAVSFAKTQKYWLHGMQVLIGAIYDVQSPAAVRASGDDLLRAVHEACRRLKQLPVLWQPDDVNDMRIYRLSEDAGSLTFLSGMGITLRAGYPAVSNFLDHLDSRQTHFNRAELATMIFCDGPGVVAKLPASALAWSWLSVVINRIGWRFANEARDNAEVKSASLRDDAVRALEQFRRAYAEARAPARHDRTLSV
jgi:glycosyltransferase involved in cell wall biosynthesis